MLYCVELDGRVSREEDTGALLHALPQSVQATSVLPATDGYLWVGLSSGGVARLNGDDRVLFDGRTGLKIPGPRWEDSQGRLYGHSEDVYAFYPEHAKPRGSLPLAPRPLTPEVVWKWRPEGGGLASAWKISRWVVAFVQTRKTSEIAIIDPETGQKTATVPVDTKAEEHVSAMPGASPDELLIVSRTQESVLDLTAGKFRMISNQRVQAVAMPNGAIRSETAYPPRNSLKIVPVGNRYLLRNGTDLQLIERSGEEVPKNLWGDSVRAVLDPVQLDQNSRYTVGYDQYTRERLWEDETGAWWGNGVAFGKDARYVVEALTWASPQILESRLIAREPRTGRRLWEYRLPGWTKQRPLVDQTRDRVLLVSQRGNAICLAGESGAEIWNTQISENPNQASMAYEPYWPAIAIQAGRLWIVDDNRVLHVLDLDRGELMASVLLTTGLSSDNTLPVPTGFLAMPWYHNDILIVAASRGIIGYRLPAVVRDL